MKAMKKRVWVPSVVVLALLQLTQVAQAAEVCSVKEQTVTETVWTPTGRAPVASVSMPRSTAPNLRWTDTGLLGLAQTGTRQVQTGTQPVYRYDTVTTQVPVYGWVAVYEWRQRLVPVYDWVLVGWSTRPELAPGYLNCGTRNEASGRPFNCGPMSSGVINNVHYSDCGGKIDVSTAVHGGLCTRRPFNGHWNTFHYWRTTTQPVYEWRQVSTRSEWSYDFVRWEWRQTGTQTVTRTIPVQTGTRPVYSTVPVWTVAPIWREERSSTVTVTKPVTVCVRPS